jgi:serine/threonine protein kinase
MLYIVMRYVGGGTLRDRINVQQRLPLREVAGVIDRVAEALEAAHAQGIIHRDIKPANILFDDRDVPYLSDFGVAKAPESSEESSEDISNVDGSMILGTPQYLSPEQAIGKPLDGRSDTYSLGIVAFHALTGAPPFKARSPVAMAMAHMTKAPPDICELLPEIPKVTGGVFERVLAKKVEDRYQTPTLFARDLRDIASGRWYLVKLTNNLGGAEASTPPPRRAAEPSTKPVSSQGPSSQGPSTVAFRPKAVEQTLVETEGEELDGDTQVGAPKDLDDTQIS